MHQILPGLHTFDSLIAGRVYLIEDPDGFTLIDAGIPPSGTRIVQQIEASGRTIGGLKRILITHAHPDHIGALKFLHDKSGAQVIASALETRVLTENLPIPMPDRASLPPLAKPMRPPETRVEQVPVDRVVSDGDTLPDVMGGLQVIATPGHAPGHLAFWQPEQRVLFMGDVLFNIPFGLRLPLAAFTVDMAENKRSLAKLCALDTAVACFGHGQPIMNDAAGRLRTFARKIGAL